MSPHVPHGHNSSPPSASFRFSLAWLSSSFGGFSLLSRFYRPHSSE
jgi:hypothetical protein